MKHALKLIHRTSELNRYVSTFQPLKIVVPQKNSKIIKKDDEFIHKEAEAWVPLIFP